MPIHGDDAICVLLRRVTELRLHDLLVLRFMFVSQLMVTKRLVQFATPTALNPKAQGRERSERTLGSIRIEHLRQRCYIIPRSQLSLLTRIYIDFALTREERDAPATWFTCAHRPGCCPHQSR